MLELAPSEDLGVSSGFSSFKQTWGKPFGRFCLSRLPCDEELRTNASLAQRLTKVPSDVVPAPY